CISRTVNTTTPTLPAAPAVLLFSGEAGAGKSRILREVAIHAQLAGVKVLGIRCSPHSSDSFTDTYESICGPTPLSSASAHYRAQSTPRQELSVCHSKYLRYAGIEHPSASTYKRNVNAPNPTHDNRRLALLNNIMINLVAEHARRPLAILIDDLQFADQETL